MLLNGKNLPVVYALLCNKKEETYNKLFNMLNHYVTNQPNNILTDFEKAVLNALRLAYPGTRLVGCYFHLVQNFWKHIQSFGLVKLYASDGEIRKNFKFLQALAFVPKKDVIFCLNQIKANCPNKFKPMLNYFEKYYVGNLKKDSLSIRHVPMFTIDLWNIHDRIVNGLPRTNNSLESWHKQFELDAKKHQTVFKLVEQFRLEQKNTDILRVQLMCGDVYKRKKKEVSKDEAIRTCVLSFNRDNLSSWLEKLILLLA